MKNYTVLALCCFLTASHTIHASLKNNDIENDSLEFTGYPEKHNQQNITQNSSTQTSDQNDGTSSPNHLSNMFAEYAKTSNSSKDEQKFSTQAENDYEDRFPKSNKFNTKITVDASGQYVKVNGIELTDVSLNDNLS